MRLLKQSMVLVRLGLSGLPQRKWSSLVLVVSVACVVGVLISMLSVTAGMLRAYRSGEDPRLAIVLSPDSNAEFGGGIPADAVGTIFNAPGIDKSADGPLLADAEFVFWVPPTGRYSIGAPTLRGIGRAGLMLRPNLRIVEGRLFHPGEQEVVIGITAARAFRLHVGERVRLPGGSWPIVGAFTDDGSIVESQYLGDAATLMAAGQMSGFSSVLVKLRSPAAFDEFAHWIANNPTLKETAERQSEFALRTGHQYSAYFTALAYVVGAMMALGALFGTVKLMYAAVGVRIREIATLRAIGYQPLPVACSVLLETILLALSGALLGSGSAWLLFNGRHVVQARSVFDLAVSPRLIGVGVAWALVLAIVGGFPPALRAARLSVADALRAL
jgi:putative ABC transport system permease protein